MEEQNKSTKLALLIKLLLVLSMIVSLVVYFWYPDLGLHRSRYLIIGSFGIAILAGIIRILISRLPLTKKDDVMIITMLMAALAFILIVFISLPAMF